MIGCLRKMQRFFDPQSGRALVLALDHGVSYGMVKGIGDIPRLLQEACRSRLQGEVLHKGLVRAHGAGIPNGMNLVVQLSGGTRHGLPPYNRSIVCSVSEALRLGADAVAVQVNIGNDLEDRMLNDFGMVTDEAHQAGLPVLAVIYARGGQIVNEMDPSLITHCVRLGGELGADLVSVLYSGEPDSFAAAVAASPVPVLVAGGPSQPDLESFLKMMRTALDCGARGVLAGRNVFQHPAPLEALQGLVRTVHGSGDEAPEALTPPAGA